MTYKLNITLVLSTCIIVLFSLVSKAAPIKPLTYDKSDEPFFGIFKKDIKEIKPPYSTNCNGKNAWRNQCKKGILVKNGYRYIGPIYNNGSIKSPEYLEGYQKSSSFKASCLFHDGKYFYGTFKDEKPESGFLIISSETYYIGEVVMNNNKISPYGKGTMFYSTGVRTGTKIKGTWRYNYLDEKKPSEKIEVIDIVKGNPKVLEDIQDEIMTLSQQRKKLEVEIDNLKRKIQRFNNEKKDVKSRINLLKEEKKVIEGEIYQEDTNSLKSMLSSIHEQNLVNLLDIGLSNSEAYNIKLNELEGIFEGSCEKTYMNYRRQLNDHVKEQRQNLSQYYTTNQCFIQPILGKSLVDYFHGTNIPPLNQKGRRTTFFVVSFPNKKSKSYYNVFFFKNHQGKYKVIQFQLLGR